MVIQDDAALHKNVTSVTSGYFSVVLLHIIPCVTVSLQRNTKLSTCTRMCTNTRPHKQHVQKVPLLEACLGLRADLITVGETGVGVLLKVALPERHRARCMLASQTVRGAGWTAVSGQFAVTTFSKQVSNSGRRSGVFISLK